MINSLMTYINFHKHLVFSLFSLFILSITYAQTDQNGNQIPWNSCIKVISFKRDVLACGTDQNHYPNCKQLWFYNSCREQVVVEITRIDSKGVENRFNQYTLKPGQKDNTWGPDFVSYSWEAGPPGTKFGQVKRNHPSASNDKKTNTSLGFGQIQQQNPESATGKQGEKKVDNVAEEKMYQEFNTLIEQYNKAASQGDLGKAQALLRGLLRMANSYFPEDVGELNTTLNLIQKAEKEALQKPIATGNSDIDKKLDQFEQESTRQKTLLNRVLNGDVAAAEELNQVNLRINDLNAYFLQHSSEFTEDQRNRFQELASKMAADVMGIAENNLANQEKELQKIQQPKKEETKVKDKWPVIYYTPSKSRDRTPLKGQAFPGGKLGSN